MKKEAKCCEEWEEEKSLLPREEREREMEGMWRKTEWERRWIKRRGRATISLSSSWSLISGRRWVGCGNDRWMRGWWKERGHEILIDVIVCKREKRVSCGKKTWFEKQKGKSVSVKERFQGLGSFGGWVAFAFASASPRSHAFFAPVVFLVACSWREVCRLVGPFGLTWSAKKDLWETRVGYNELTETLSSFDDVRCLKCWCGLFSDASALNIF